MEYLAQEKLLELKSQATTQIKDLFSDKKKVEIQIMIPSSKILVPRKINSKQSSLVVLDTGNISFERSLLSDQSGQSDG